MSPNFRNRDRVPNSQGLLVGIGDDAAVLAPHPQGTLTLYTCDGVIEGVHFDRTLKPYDVGYKAMARNVSDIAAMGGTPSYALIGLELPKSYSPGAVDELYRGLNVYAKKCGIAIAGGDTVRSAAGLGVWVSLLGYVRPEHLKLRRGAKPGDAIFVTGTLGGSILKKHAAFQPRLKEAQYLVKHFPVRAMMDVSDGVAIDLPRLCAQSGVGAWVDVDRLPISAAAKKLAGGRAGAWKRALCDGEDYELLFSAQATCEDALKKAFRKKFSLKISRIGQIMPGPKGSKPGMFPKPDLVQYTRKLSQGGYDHFR